MSHSRNESGSVAKNTQALAAPVSRRRFLSVTGTLAGLAAFHGAAGRSAARLSRDLFSSSDPFSLGVASGDPGGTSVVLWTRLAPDPLNGGGMGPEPVEVRWEVALDETMRRVIRSGSTMAFPEWAHSVRVTVQGLPPDRWLWYRFQAAGAASPIGRTRTMPPRFAPAERLRFALASCQDFQNGFYSAYHNMAREDLDFVVHVGDYIYENGPRKGAPRQVTGGETRTLEDYRNRYALYKLDPSLQAVQAAFPFIVTWDDHEVDNDYAGASPDGRQLRRPFLRRRANAYRAYFEHMPLQEFSRPQDGVVRLFRRLAFGDLVELHVLDTRQFRTDQPCGDGVQRLCEGALDPNATMMGAEQEQWLSDGLSSSRSTWNVIAQQVMMMKWAIGSPALREPFFNMDAWDGYQAARDRILRVLAGTGSSNQVVLTGDIHSNWVADLKADFEDEGSPVVGAEFVTTSITSSFPAPGAAVARASLPRNPHIKFFEGGSHGYVRCEVDQSVWRADYRAVASILDPTAPVRTIASFIVEAGIPGVIRA